MRFCLFMPIGLYLYLLNFLEIGVLDVIAGIGVATLCLLTALEALGVGTGLGTLQTILLPQDIRWELLYRYSSPVKSAYGKRSEYHLLNASFTKRLFGDRLTCKLALNGLLFNQKSRSVISTDDIYKSEAMYGRTSLTSLFHCSTI